ncbi:triose-phosphate transporter family-domain-containing protein [Russula earlei]|uniref:Triose-phosphate transporter family-domain-containing protein n=1 Tax=Russula earlei TaxID=71964 RepID=A0ACC0U8T6_9AGAM|nr:triose-phosphate transporter family-domain-containing protein [Russula earlei]
MATEKFFENGGRPLDVERQQTAQFLNPKSEERDAGSDSASGPLPSPASASPAKPKPKLTASMIIPVWIVLSSSVIIYNNYLYNTLNFKYPVFLVTFHLGFAAIGTRILERTTHLLDGAKDVHLTKDMFVRSILPIGLLFSASLILSNTAYLYLSVAYIQMLKAFTPVAILLISWLFRIQEPNRKLTTIVCMISFGVALASHGELRFNLIGFLTQAAAVAVRIHSHSFHTFRCSAVSPLGLIAHTQFEASRLVMIQILLHGLKMDPLVSLHYYAPVCAVINLAILPFTEGLAPFFELARIGPLVLFSNAAVAFALNIAAVFLVSAGSGLVLTLAGVFKDILLITGSVLIFGSQITPLQVFGYSIALGGLILFKTSGGK